jgi:hypothetical protein
MFVVPRKTAPTIPFLNWSLKRINLSVLSLQIFLSSLPSSLPSYMLSILPLSMPIAALRMSSVYVPVLYFVSFFLSIKREAGIGRMGERRGRESVRRERLEKKGGEGDEERSQRE